MFMLCLKEERRMLRKGKKGEKKKEKMKEENKEMRGKKWKEKKIKWRRKKERRRIEVNGLMWKAQRVNTNILTGWGADHPLSQNLAARWKPKLSSHWSTDFADNLFIIVHNSKKVSSLVRWLTCCFAYQTTQASWKCYGARSDESLNSRLKNE